MKFNLPLSAACLGLSLAATPLAAETLQLATVAPEGSIWHRQMMPFVEAVNASGTDLTIEVFPAGQLGNMADTFRNMMSGRTDIWVGVLPVVASVVPELGLFSLPYMYENNEEMKCMVPQLVDEMQGAVAGRFEMLNILPVGSQDVEGVNPIRVPSDLQGVTMRVAPNVSSVAFFQSAGATPQMLPASETPSALNTGLVEALDFDIVYYTLMGLVSTAPNYTPTNHNYNLGSINVSARTWARLNADQQAALRSAAEAIDFPASVDGVTAFQDMMMQRSISEGANLLELTDDERNAWLTAGRAVWDDVLADTRGDVTGFMASIDAARANCH